jgi:hypothetical protein
VCRQCRSAGSPKPCDIDCNIRALSTCTYALQLTARHGVYSCHCSNLMSVRARCVFISVANAKALSRRRATLARVSRQQPAYAHTIILMSHAFFGCDTALVMFLRMVFFVFPCGAAILRRCGMAGATKQPYASLTRSHNKHEPRSSTYNTQRADDVLVVS